MTSDLSQSRGQRDALISSKHSVSCLPVPVSSCMPCSPPPVSKDDPPPAPESCDSSGQRGATEDGGDAQTVADRPVKTDPGKVPKWLKLPGVFKSLLQISYFICLISDKRR